MEAWNKAISDYRIKAILKMCSALTAWTWVNKEHRTESTSSVCRMFMHTHVFSFTYQIPFCFLLVLEKYRVSYEIFS